MEAEGTPKLTGEIFGGSGGNSLTTYINSPYAGCRHQLLRKQIDCWQFTALNRIVDNISLPNQQSLNLLSLVPSKTFLSVLFQQICCQLSQVNLSVEFRCLKRHAG